MKPKTTLAIFGITAVALKAVEFGGMISGADPAAVLERTVSNGRLTWVRVAERHPEKPPVAVHSVVYPGATSKRLQVAGGIPETAYPTDLWKVFETARTQLAANPLNVSAWEIGNEPDFIFSRDLPDLTAAATKAAWFGLREGGAKGKIFMPSLAFRPGPYAAELLANDLGRFTDGWNFHFYGWAQDFEANLREHRRLQSEYGLNLPLWITEAGFAELNGDGSPPPHFLLQRQASYFERITVDAWMNGVEGFAAFTLSPYHADGMDYGLVERNHTPRPALDTYLGLARRLSACRPLYQLKDIKTRESVGAVIRLEDGHWWTLLWTPNRRAENDLPSPRRDSPALAAPPASFYNVRLHPGIGAAIGTTHDTAIAGKPAAPFDFTLSAGTNLHVVSPPGKFQIEDVEWVSWKPPAKTRRAEKPNPVVVQIRPEPGVAPDRDGLCYRFHPDQPPRFEVVAYNFSKAATSGTLRLGTPAGWTLEGDREVKLRLGPRSAATNRISLTPSGTSHSQLRYPVTAIWSAFGKPPSKASVVIAPERNADESFTTARWYPDWHGDPPATAWKAEAADDGALRITLQGVPSGELPGIIAPLPDEFVPKATDELHLVLRHHEGVRPSGARVELVTEGRVVTFSNRTSEITPEGWEGNFRLGDFEPAFWSHADPERKWKPADIRYVRLQFGGMMPGTVIDIVSVELRRVPDPL